MESMIYLEKEKQINFQIMKKMFWVEPFLMGRLGKGEQKMF